MNCRLSRFCNNRVLYPLKNNRQGKVVGLIQTWLYRLINSIKPLLLPLQPLRRLPLLLLRLHPALPLPLVLLVRVALLLVALLLVVRVALLLVVLVQVLVQPVVLVRVPLPWQVQGGWQPPPLSSTQGLS
jgi:hypothetical protein